MNPAQATPTLATLPNLRVHLYRGPLPTEGTAVRAPKPFSARMALDSDGPTVHVGLPALSPAELRWGVSQIVGRVRGLVRAGRVTVAFHGVEHDTALTLALDLHARFRGHLTLLNAEAVAAELGPIAGAEAGYRRWVNEDPSVRTSLQIAADAQIFAAARPDVALTVLAEDDLKRLGMGLLLAVGQASEVSPPRLVIAEYTPPGGASASPAAPLMLLGKGITFDTGGINLKPYLSHVSQMKNDMAGAALAWWLFRGLVASGYPRRLVLVIPTCENAIGHAAMRPGALLRSYRGLQVRVDHTDAEGRLVLADGLAYATDTYAPSQVLCFATLTTAALIAYGPYATPVHFADPKTQAALQAASEALGEDLHFFPERLWHLEANRDGEADLKNTARLPGAASRGAGSRNAAHFLKHFTQTPLVHFDIFASTWDWAGDAPGATRGATGTPLRTVLRALRASA